MYDYTLTEHALCGNFFNPEPEPKEGTFSGSFREHWETSQSPLEEIDSLPTMYIVCIPTLCVFYMFENVYVFSAFGQKQVLNTA